MIAMIFLHMQWYLLHIGVSSIAKAYFLEVKEGSKNQLISFCYQLDLRYYTEVSSSIKYKVVQVRSDNIAGLFEGF